MSIVLPTLPITELHTKQPKVLNHLSESPVVLTRRGQGAAVLVSPEQWNRQQAEIQRLRLFVEAMQIKAKGEPTVSLAEVKKCIAAKKASSTAELGGESKTEALPKTLQERHDRLQLLLEKEIWPRIPATQKGIRLTKTEEEAILGYGEAST